VGSQHLRVYSTGRIIYSSGRSNQIIQIHGSKVTAKLLDPIAALLLWIQLDTSWIQVLLPISALHRPGGWRPGPALTGRAGLASFHAPRPAGAEVLVLLY